MKILVRLPGVLVALCIVGVQGLVAQEPATLTGTVTAASGQPLEAASVVVEGMNLGTLTNQQGRYLLIIPASRVTGQDVTVAASLIGRTTARQQVTLRAGTQQVNFQLGEDPLRLEEIVVTGAGLQTQRQRLGVTINSVEAEAITQSQEPNIVSALAGKAPNVEVISSAGDPGAGSYIRVRGANSLIGTNQPLFVVDGVPIDNSTTNIESTTAGTVLTNRAFDLNPNDIESVEILKGPAAAAVYGSRAANGVVLVTTKSGRPGTNRVQYTSSFSFDEVNATQELQRSYGQGLAGVPGLNEAFGLAPGQIPRLEDPGTDICADVYGLPRNRCPTSWGVALGSGVPTFDHAREIYDTGHRFDQHLTWSGGSEQTTYYLSIGRMDHDGVIKGNSEYARTTVRLKGDHAFRDDLRIGGNFAYTSGRGEFVQQGSNISGVQLGALRTPPDFNNLPYLTPEGLHRSYRLPNPTSVTQGRGYDNPFWIANELPNLANVNRTFGNINANYTPFRWLSVNYTLGADYTADERTSVFPKSSSDFPTGRMIRADIINLEVDHNLVATANHELNDDISGSLSIGQNLNHREYSEYQVNGTNLIFGTDQLDFAVTRVPDEYRETIRTDGYFAQLAVDLYDQLFLTGGVRYDGSSTFGGADQRFAYPKFSAAWDFSSMVEETPLSFGKLRFAFGVAGKQPPVFSNVSAFETATIFDGWVFTPNGLQTIYAGREGVISEPILGNADIAPERTSEWEVGADLAFFDNRLSLGATYYKQHTTDAILDVDVAPSTGYFSKFANAAEFENEGFEITADFRAIQRDGFSWTVGAQWATNESCVLDLAGVEQVFLTGFTGSENSVVAPRRDDAGNIVECYPIGAHYMTDFVRFGRGSRDQVSGVSIDSEYPGWSEGDLYIGADGFPQQDPQSRVTGDATPDWLGSVRNTIQLGDNLRISGLVDIRRGGDVWNGTRGALTFFGTHKDTEPYHGAGKAETFGETYYTDENVHGPGAGQEVTLNWLTWFWNGIGSGFTGPSSQFVEDGSFVKLRDISVSYTFRNQSWLSSLGFSSLDLGVAGRNLRTWTDYTGIDPESNLNSQTLGRGIDYFNNPQTRSWVVNFTLTR